MVKAKLNVGFVATLSGRWPRERPQKLQTLYGDWAERELTGVNVCRYPEIVTNTDEAVACADWLRARQADVVLLVIGAFTGDDVSCKLSQELGKPILLWATHEAPFVRQERLWANAMCSAMMNNAAVKRIGGECYPVYGDLDEPEVTGQIKTMITALSAKKKLANTSLGLLGYRPTAFYNCAFDELAIRRLFGIRMEGTELKLVFDRMAQLDAGAVHADMDKVRAQFGLDKLPRLSDEDRNLSEENLENHSRTYLALKELIPEFGYDYCTIKCWPEMGAVKCQPCAVLSRLADDGISVICEGDVDAGIGTIIEREMTGQPTFVADMINMDRQANTLTFWHCGNAPLSLYDMSDGLELRNHPLIGNGSAFWGVLKPGKVTVVRASVIDGQYHLVVLRGEAVPTKRNTRGTMVNVQVARPVEDVTRDIFDKGIAHHYSLVWADIGDAVVQLGRLLHIPVIEL